MNSYFFNNPLVEAMSELNRSQASIGKDVESPLCITGAFRIDQAENEGCLSPGNSGKTTTFWPKKGPEENKFLKSLLECGGSLPIISLIRVTKLLNDDQLSNNDYFCGSRHLLPFNIKYSIFLN